MSSSSELLAPLIQRIEDEGIDEWQKRVWRMTALFAGASSLEIRNLLYCLRNYVYNKVYWTAFPLESHDLGGERFVSSDVVLDCQHTDEVALCSHFHLSLTNTLHHLSETLLITALVMSCSFEKTFVALDVPMYTARGLLGYLELVRPIDPGEDCAPTGDKDKDFITASRVNTPLPFRFTTEEHPPDTTDYKTVDVNGKVFPWFSVTFENGSKLVLCDGLLHHDYLQEVDQTKDQYAFRFAIKHGPFDSAWDGKLFSNHCMDFGLEMIANITRNTNTHLFLFDWARSEEGLPTKKFVRTSMFPETLHLGGNVKDMARIRAAEVFHANEKK